MQRWHEFGVMLGDIEWTIEDFARVAGVDPETVERWKKQDSVPLIAVRFLRTYLMLALLVRGGVLS